MNSTENDMTILCCIGITINDDNDTVPENLPKQQEQQQGNTKKDGEVCNSEGISLTGNLQTRGWGVYTCWRIPHNTVSHSLSSVSNILTK